MKIFKLLQSIELFYQKKYLDPYWNHFNPYIRHNATLNGKPFSYTELIGSLKYNIIVIAVFVLGFSWAYDKFKK